jgi:hypothetical protein
MATALQALAMPLQQQPTVPAAGGSSDSTAVQAAAGVVDENALVPLQINVPTGLRSGGRLAFTTPDGQQLVVTVAEGVVPGGSVNVRYAPLRREQPISNLPPLPPLLVPLATQEADRVAAKLSWGLYIGSWACCLCCFPIAIFFSPLTWMINAAMYFCKPQQLRNHFQRQRTPAVTSLFTCIVATFLVFTLCVGWAGFLMGASEAGTHHIHWGHHHEHGHDYDSDGHESDIDWQSMNEACPAVAKYRKNACSTSEECDRKPSMVEMQEMCNEVFVYPCNLVAASAGALHIFENHCSGFQQTTISTSIDVNNVKASPSSSSE